MKKITAFIISHGHLDIEWYLPLRVYRFWTLDAIDRQIQLYQEDPEVVPYTVDGQMFPLELYLQARPEKTGIVQEMVARGKLHIGPFFTQFDEWLPSGESMVRNCLVGKLHSERLGQRMRIGYLPDNFGHPAQLPQILDGFGIHSLLFMRGLPYIEEDFPDEFLFEGMDGSRLTAIHFRKSYSSMFTRQDPWKYFLDNTPFRDTPYYHGLISSEHLETLATIDDPQAFAARMIEHVHSVSRWFPSGIVPVVIGCDHCPPHVGLRQAMETANAMSEEIDFITGSPEAYLAEVDQRNPAMPVYRGELYGARFQYLLSGAFSTRAYLKRMNFAAEAMLERYAEPLEALAALHGAAGDKALLDEAWQMLLTNHAHDSIHGSSVDEVHAEMIPRFDGALQTGAGLAHRALAAIAARVNPDRWAAHRALAAIAAWANPARSIADLIVYRPVPRAPIQFSEQWLPMHQADTAAQQPPLLRAEDGAVLASQVLPRPPAELNELGEIRNDLYPTNAMEKVLFEIPAESTSLSMVRLGYGQSPSANTLICGADFIENEHLRLCARGPLIDVYDKASQQWYKGLNVIQEAADAGDYWDSSPTWLPSETVFSTRSKASCEVVERGPVRASLRICSTMNVPQFFKDGARSDARVDLPVCFTVSLWKDTKRVDVRLELENTARDHRLSLFVNPFIQSQDVISKTVFGIVHRPAAVKPALPGRTTQPEGILYPFREWVALQDQQRGLAVAVKGLYDYEADIDKYTGQTILQLTLLRSVGNMTRLNTRARQGNAAYGIESESAQCLGKHVIEYAYIPFASTGTDLPFLVDADAFLYPPLAHRILSQPPVASQPLICDPFAWEEDNIAFSAFKRAEDGNGYILRLYEAAGKAVSACIRLNGFQTAVLCRLDETQIAPLEMQDGCIRVDFAPHKIVSIRLR